MLPVFKNIFWYVANCQSVMIIMLTCYLVNFILMYIKWVLLIRFQCRVSTRRSLLTFWLSPHCALRLSKVHWTFSQCYWWSHLFEVMYRSHHYCYLNVTKMLPVFCHDKNVNLLPCYFHIFAIGYAQKHHSPISSVKVIYGVALLYIARIIIISFYITYYI